LFSKQSKTQERDQMTAEQNATLDTVIEACLGLLGGRLLLSPAAKAAEWLVRRFRYAGLWLRPTQIADIFSLSEYMSTTLRFFSLHSYPTMQLPSFATFCRFCPRRCLLNSSFLDHTSRP